MCLVRCGLGQTVCVFFFQAEDGIRDGRVTGVQTCALPISGFNDLSLKPAAVALENLLQIVGRPPAGGATAVDVTLTRSEERRVGKECRSRRSPASSNKKDDS